MKEKSVISISSVLYLILLLTGSGLHAQLPSLYQDVNNPASRTGQVPGEELFLHIDREKYIAGEEIWFSIYGLQYGPGTVLSGSAIAYIELINPWNVPVIQKRFQLTNGRGSGNLSVPDTISSGTYCIRAYTNWMKNFLPENCYMQYIGIYNPFKGTGFRERYDDGSMVYDRIQTSASKNGIVLLRSDSTVGRREKVSVEISLFNQGHEGSEDAGISISVVPSEVSDLHQWNDRPGVTDNRSEVQFGPETDFHYLSGKISYRDTVGKSISGFLYMSVQGKVADFRYATIDPSGRFSFMLPVDSRSRNLILQPGQAVENMVLEIEQSFPYIQPAVSSYKMIAGDSLSDIFQELSFNYQASKIYGTVTKGESKQEETRIPENRRFYGIPEMEILLEDYIKLPSMEEVFLELLPGVILRSKKSGYEIKITNPLTGVFYEEPPLVMIDGVILSDLNVLVDLDPERVEKIEVTKTPYLMGDIILHGIVNVITREGDFSSITMPEYAVILPYRVVEVPAHFVSPQYPAETDRSGRKPDLRNTLYWNPSLKTGEKGDAVIEFWTSDITGHYTIVVRGIDSRGQRLLLTKSFQVK